MREYELRALAAELDAFPMRIPSDGLVHAVRYTTLNSVCGTWHIDDLCIGVNAMTAATTFPDYEIILVTCMRCLGGQR